MKKNPTYFILFIIVLILCNPFSSLAQMAPGDPECDPGVACPIDSNIVILIVVAVIIAAKKAYYYKKNSIITFV